MVARATKFPRLIHIRDTVACVALAVENPPERGVRVKILNQMSETYRVLDLANMVAAATGVEIAMVDNPRNEVAENDLNVSNAGLIALGLEPLTLEDDLLTETLELAQKYADRCRMDLIPCVSTWTAHQNIIAAE